MTSATQAQQADQAAQAQAIIASGSLWRIALRRMFRRMSSVVGLTMLTGLILVAIFAEQIAPYNPTQVLIGIEDARPQEPPCIHALGCPADRPQHILGVDGNVRDEFSRVIYGSRVSLRSEEHTSELQSPTNLVCRLLLEKKKNDRRMFVWTKETVIAGKCLWG